MSFCISPPQKWITVQPKKSKGYRKNYKGLPGSPDIALTKYKIAIFCDSEFFHGKDWHQVLKPRLEKGKNPEYWVKIQFKNPCMHQALDLFQPPFEKPA